MVQSGYKDVGYPDVSGWCADRYADRASRVMSVLRRCDPELGQHTSSLSAESLSRRPCCVWIHPVVPPGGSNCH